MSAPINPFREINNHLDQLEQTLKNSPEKLKDSPFQEINRITRLFHQIPMGRDLQAHTAISERITKLTGQIKILKEKNDDSQTQTAATVNQFAQEKNRPSAGAGAAQKPNLPPQNNRAAAPAANQPAPRQNPPPQNNKPAAAAAAAPQPVQQANRVAEMRAAMKAKMPVLASLIEGYQQGKSVKLAEYEQKYIEVMIKELGYPQKEVYSESKMGKIMEPKEIYEIFDKVREKLEIKDLVFLPFDDRVPANARTLGSFLTGEGHNSFAIYQNGVYNLCAEYPEDRSQNNAAPTRRLAAEQLIAECEQPIEIKVSPLIAQKNNQFTGKITNMNSCALESTIFCLSYILA